VADEEGALPRPLELLGEGVPVPLGFVLEGNRLFLVARDRSARWPTAILRDGCAELRLPSGVVRGPVRLVIDAGERTSVLERFRAKYGEAQFQRWYEHPARILEVRVDQPVPILARGERYQRWLTDEFDNVADEYDRHIRGNRMNMLLRDRSLARLRSVFAGAPNLIEIGCGSGMETLPLLEEGHEMTCVDISQRMLEVVGKKARAAGVAERLRRVRARASELPGLLPQLGAGSFDGAYSTYGALNCEERVDRLPAALHELLRERGAFVAGVYNRWCLFELVGYGLTGRWGRAVGRRDRPIRVGTSRFCVDVYAYSPAEFAGLFRPWFDATDLEGVPVVLPPSDLVAYAEKLSRNFDRLAAVDRALGRRWPLRSLGDHFLWTFRRRSRAAAGG
jgi:SAM-dependent methyltransferase